MPKTNIPQLKFVNVETGEEIVREATVEEIAEIEAKQIASAEAQAAANAKAAQRRAILEHLKITEEEARILLGGN